MEFRSWHIAIVCLKTLLAYVGTAWVTALIKISFPVLLNNFSFHPCVFLHTRSLILVKTSLFERPINDGSSKYFSCCLMSGTPQLRFYSLFHFCPCILAEEDICFFLVDQLS